MCPRVFVSGAGTPVDYRHFCLTFGRAVDAAGIGTGSAVRPRIHDLRHSFAVRTLIDWHRTGDDVAALLPGSPPISVTASPATPTAT